MYMDRHAKKLFLNIEMAALKSKIEYQRYYIMFNHNPFVFMVNQIEKPS